VHEYASALSKELFARALARPVTPGRAPVVAFLAGGGGSGKSTAGGPAIEGINPDIIVDGTLSNVDRACREIEASLASGRRAGVVYVYRSPEKSAQGAIDRAIDMGRPVPADVLAEAHANAPKTVKTLTQIYNGNEDVEIEAIWNDGELKDRRPLPIEEIPDVNRKLAEHVFQSAVESAKATGRLTPKLYATFRGGNPSKEIGRKTPDREMDIDTGRNRRLEEGNAQVYRGTEQTNSGNFTQDSITGSDSTSAQETQPDVNQEQAEHTFRTAVESANSAGRLPSSLYKGFLPPRPLGTRDRQENERNRPEQPTRHPVTFDGDTSKVDETPNVNQRHAEHTFRSTVESANVAGKLSPKLYAAFRGGEAPIADRGRAPYRDMDYETGRNHQPGEEDAQTHRKNEATRPQQYAQDPITESNSNTTADIGEYVETASEPETGPSQDAPNATAPIHTAPANAPIPPVTGPTAAASPQPEQPIDPQQQRQLQAEAFKQDPAQAVETFPGLAAAHNTYQAVATKAANMRSPQRRDNLLSLLKNKLAQRIQHGQRIPSPKQAVTWASNLVNGRSRGD